MYDLEVSLIKDGEVLDTVDSYFGMRKIEYHPDEDGYQRLYLNDEPVFMFGTLDQGYWPDGIYTAPTDEALMYDIQKHKELGYNTIRKHIKVRGGAVLLVEGESMCVYGCGRKHPVYGRRGGGGGPSCRGGALYSGRGVKGGVWGRCFLTTV